MKNLSRVEKISRILEWSCSVAIVVIPAGLAVIWATLDWWLTGGGRAIVPDLWQATDFPIPHPIPAASLVSGYLASMIAGAVVVYGVWQLRALFALYRRGLIFTSDNILRLRRFALAVLALTFASPLSNTLVILALTLGNPPGQRFLSIGISSSQLVTLFIGAVFLVIAWVMDEGRELAEDQAQIV